MSSQPAIPTSSIPQTKTAAATRTTFLFYPRRIHARARCVTIAVAAITLVACGERGPAGGGPANAQPFGSAPVSTAATAAVAGSPVGAWERFIPNREAPVAYEVLELFDTGWLILHNAQGGVNAQYNANGGRLALQGALAMFWRDPITYDISGNTLTLDIPALGPLARSEWTRVQRDAFFGIAAVEGDTVPAKLPELLAAATAGAARDWRSDAIPVALDVQRLPSGDFAATLTYVSPTDLAGLRVIVGRWGFIPTELPRASLGDHALPTEFADAPALRTRLTSGGNRDPLLHASLRVWSKGPVWTVTTLGAGGRQTRTDLVAATAARLVPDAPPPAQGMDEAEYIASYNAQWDAISKAFARNRGGGGRGGPDWEPTPWTPGSSGGGAEPAAAACAFASYGACNAAAAGDLWGAERIENGTASDSERDWYE